MKKRQTWRAERWLAKYKGQRFGRLVVLGPEVTVKPNGDRFTRARVQCDCGVITSVHPTSLGKNANSCGCFRREYTHEKFTTHGKSSLLEYHVWRQMIARCTNPKHPEYFRYGARGIKVCRRWLKVENFLADMLPRPPGLSLDRIDNDGNYEPRNCRWATAAMQSRNTRRYRAIHGEQTC